MHAIDIKLHGYPKVLDLSTQLKAQQKRKLQTQQSTQSPHLKHLQDESIHIIREAVAESENPVMLYSIGKDSAVMLHLALKAFHPAKLPFPLLHVDTGWKFKDMYAFRDRMQAEHDFKLLVHQNPDGIAMGTRFLMTSDSGVPEATLARYLATRDAEKIQISHLVDGMPQRMIPNEYLAMLEKACSYANRNGTPLTVVVIDLDHFKRINDTWGHKAGDDVLRSFVAVTSSVVRNEDVIGRLGGEEFCVYLPETSLADAGDVANRIRRACAGDAVASGGQVIHYTASIGVARYEANEMPDAVIHRADQIMYRAKNLGRNRVERQEDARVPT